jgi:hypothetical protein
MDMEKLLALLRNEPNTNRKQEAWREYVIRHDIEMAKAMGKDKE